MHQVAACSRIGAVPACCRSQLLRPVQHHGRHIPFQPAVVRRSLQSSRKRECTCSAGDQDSKLQTNSEDDVRPEISKTKLADKGADTEVPKLGLAGTIATWALLIFLFGGSLFFTFSRSFLPDMQPLDANSPEIVSNF
ncbi:TPA: hypothetical protein ACH3X2_013218 [Trebouxia sp. C0005]